jgi:hypothetical protein
MHLAMLLLGQNDLQSADTEAQTAVSLLVPEHSHLDTVTSASPEEKMTALIDLSLVRCASGASQSAIPVLQSALKIAHDTYPQDSVPVGYIDFLLGYAEWKSGDYGDARERMSQGVRELGAEIGWGHPVYLGTLRQYRTFLVETKQPEKARQIAAEIERLDRSTKSFTVALGNAPIVENPSSNLPVPGLAR